MNIKQFSASVSLVIAVCAVSNLAHAAAPPLINLGSFDNGSSFADGLNASGQVVGRSSAGSKNHAFLWDAISGLQDLHALAGLAADSSSEAIAINNAGQVIIDVVDSSFNHTTYVWDPVHGAQNIGFLGFPYTTPVAINNLGQVTGVSLTTTGRQHGFIWDAVHGMQDIGTLGGAITTPRAINDAGQIVGDSFPATGGSLHAFIWDAAHGMQDLNPSATSGHARAINLAGQVTGDSNGQAFVWDATHGLQFLCPGFGFGINASGQVVGQHNSQAFFWDASHGVIDLGTLGGNTSYATAINSAGKVIGFSNITASQDGHAFVWEITLGLQDLGTFGGPLNLSTAVAINDDNQIAGSSNQQGSNQRAFIVTLPNTPPPDVSQAEATTQSLWPANHKLVTVGISGVVDPSNTTIIAITGVTQDEPTNGQGDGDTDVDAIINTNGTVQLRAERAGSGDGRVYHVHFTATNAGGSVAGVVLVTVPHDKKSTAIDGGELYDSTN